MKRLEIWLLSIRGSGGEAHLLNLQKELARTQDVVMDGRDIGTCVLPEADVKIS